MRDGVTFIHAADLHLGSPFKGVSAADDRVGRDLAEATYEALRAIVDLAIARHVDFVVIAGDVYDSVHRSVRSGFFVRDQARRLAEKDIPLFMIHGNHDPLGSGASPVEMPDNVHVFPAGQVERAEVITDGGLVCGIYGRSFGQVAETEDFSPGYQRDPRDSVAVGVLHSNVGSNPDYEPYAPATLDALRARKMDYWALGHIHKRQELSHDPWAVYSGSPQGLNPKETGVHGCYVVHVTASGAPSAEFAPVSTIAWAHLEIDLTGQTTLDAVERLVSDGFGRLLSDNGCRTIVRIRFTGATTMHSALADPLGRSELLEQLRSEYSAGSPWIWIDEISDATRTVVDVANLAQEPSFAGEVVRVAEELASQDSALEELAAEAMAPVRTKLGGRLEQPDDLEGLLVRARDRALALLVTEGDGR